MGIKWDVRAGQWQEEFENPTAFTGEWTIHAGNAWTIRGVDNNITAGGTITLGFLAALPKSRPPDHVFDYAAGPPGYSISLCSRCGLRWSGPVATILCVPVVDPGRLRASLEQALAKATRDYDEHMALVRKAEARRVPPAPDYQNVSAAIRNVVGGWNRR